ncbi:MAG: fumarylacetoacetate hydrolase family protein [Desulfobacterota bacterium]|nr:fumarylacetoacetate hydrolase family protein [Thermodesulfobacteriota bacterium]
MKLVRCIYQGTVRHGILEGEDIHLVRSKKFERHSITNTVIPLREVMLCAPCVPSKIVAVGLNYRAHAGELNMPVPEEPLLFLKPPSAVIGHHDAIVMPAMSRRVDYEGELAVVIGKPCRHVLPENAPHVILGYTCCNDVTARDLQKKDGQFTRSKGFDTFCPVGPWIETELDPNNLVITTKVNSVTKQHAWTGDMIFSVFHLVSFISQIMTLLPGDIIATGTPPGIGPLQPGDRVDITIQGIGTLSNSVVNELKP